MRDEPLHGDPPYGGLRHLVHDEDQHGRHALSVTFLTRAGSKRAGDHASVPSRIRTCLIGRPGSSALILGSQQLGLTNRPYPIDPKTAASNPSSPQGPW